MSEFTAITYEVLISGAWVDLSANVKADPAPHCSRGINGNEPEDRVADPGKLTFSLNNSEDNSVGLVGYYSPGHANCLSGWGPSLPVRLSFTFEGYTKIKWRGYIDRDGIKVIPGTSGPRRVDVTCTDWMGIASSHKVSLLQLATNQTMTQAMTTLLGNMSIRPRQTSFDTTINMPSVFDQAGSETTALGEMNKIASSMRGNLYLRAGGDGEELVVDGNAGIPIPSADITDFILLEDGTNLLLEDGTNVLMDLADIMTITGTDMLEDTDISYGAKLYNYLTVITNPRKVDAAATTVLWTLEQSTAITAGSTITIRGQYNNPSVSAKAVRGTAMVTPVSGTDYKANAAANGSGTDKTASLGVVATYGAAEVELQLTNNDAATIYIGGGANVASGVYFQVRGKGIYFDDPVHEIFRNDASIAAYGVRPYVMELKYQTEPVVAGSIKGVFSPLLWVNQHADPYYVPERIMLSANKDARNMLMFIFCEPGMPATVSEGMTDLSDSFYIQSYDFEIQGNGIVMWSVVCKDQVS